MATWPSGKAEACKAFTPGSNPGVASNFDNRLAKAKRTYADMAQLVEHHLAKVGVAGSNPVVRSRISNDPVTRPGRFFGINNFCETRESRYHELTPIISRFLFWIVGD